MKTYNEGNNEVFYNFGNIGNICRSVADSNILKEIVIFVKLTCGTGEFHEYPEYPILVLRLVTSFDMLERCLINYFTNCQLMLMLHCNSTGSFSQVVVISIFFYLPGPTQKHKNYVIRSIVPLSHTLDKINNIPLMLVKIVFYAPCGL